MIEARYWQRPGRWKLVLQGHADYGPPGQDILCAAVSALIAALEERLENARGPRSPLAWVRIQPGEGAGIEAAARPGREELVEGWFSLICEGLEALAVLYPENLRFAREETDGPDGPGKEKKA